MIYKYIRERERVERERERERRETENSGMKCENLKILNAENFYEIFTQNILPKHELQT